MSSTVLAFIMFAIHALLAGENAHPRGQLESDGWPRFAIIARSPVWVAVASLERRAGPPQGAVRVFGMPSGEACPRRCHGTWPRCRRCILRTPANPTVNRFSIPARFGDPAGVCLDHEAADEAAGARPVIVDLDIEDDATLSNQRMIRRFLPITCWRYTPRFWRVPAKKDVDSSGKALSIDRICS